MTICKRCRPVELLLACILVTCLSIGCKKEADPQLYVTAGTALQKATEAMEQKDYQAALASLDVALAGGGLSPDQYSEALLGRAECHGRLGNFAKAHEDLDRAERGAAMDQVHRVRSFVFQKEGRTGESQAELGKARQINPALKAIEE